MSFQTGGMQSPSNHTYAICVGDRVRELDSLITGVVTKIHNNYGITHIVMQGYDKKIYDHGISHYQFLE